MGLEGQLNDLPLVEMLQIVAFSKKTGYLRIEAPPGRGVVAVSDGRVLFACSWSTIPELRELAERPENITREGNRAIIEASLRELTSLREGRFWFEPTTAISDELAGVRIRPFMAPGGLEPQELLLGLAVEVDGERREATTLLELAFEGEPEFELTEEFDRSELGLGSSADKVDPAPNGASGSFDVWSSRRADSAARRESDLKAAEHAYLSRMSRKLVRADGATDISRLVLRVAARFLERGVLFLVKHETARGVAAFGLGSSFEDAVELSRRVVIDVSRVRAISALLDGATTSYRFGNDTLGEMAAPVLEAIGSGKASEGVFMAMLYKRRALVLLYGDNGETGGPVGDLDGLELFIAQAGMAIENKLLQRKLEDHERVLLLSAG